MTSDEKDLELIERFLEKKMEPDELAKFESRLSHDEQLIKAVAELKDVIAGIDAQGRVAFESDVASWEKEIGAQSPVSNKPVIPIRRYLLWAAVILVVLLPLGYWFLDLGVRTPTKEELFITYFKPYDDVITKRSSEPDENTFQQAMNAYNNERYKQAAEIFEGYRLEQPGDDVALFYLSQAYLASGQYGEATTILIEVSKSTNPLFAEKGEWDLALVLLTANNIESTKERLGSILENESHGYYKSAQKLLKQLEKGY